MNRSSVNIARLVYLLVCQAAGVAIALSTKGTPIEMSVAAGMLIGLAIGFAFIGIERLMEGFTLRGFMDGMMDLGPVPVRHYQEARSGKREARRK